MWMALAVVAPVVMGAAWSVRRGEVARQEVSTVMRNELPPDISKSADQNLGAGGATEITVFAPGTDFRFDYHPDAQILEVIDIGTSMWPALGGDIIVYWSEQATSSARADGSVDLPSDVYVLGAWPASGVARFAIPKNGVAGQAGALFWYSLTRSSVVRSRRVDAMNWNQR